MSVGLFNEKAKRIYIGYKTHLNMYYVSHKLKPLYKKLCHYSFSLSFMLYLFSVVYYLCGTLLGLGVICYAGSGIYREH